MLLYIPIYNVYCQFSYVKCCKVAVSSVFSDLIPPPHSYQGSDPILLSIIVPILPFGPSYAPDCVIVMWQHILKDVMHTCKMKILSPSSTQYSIMTSVIIRNSLTTYNVIPIQTSHSDFSLSELRCVCTSVTSTQTHLLAFK